MPWAYTCYGYHYLPKRHGCAPQVMIDPVEAAVVRDIYRALVEEQLSCRQITKRLNVAKTPTPTGKNAVWQHATVHNILTNRTYTGQARYNYRQPVLPQSRKKEEHRLQYLKTGRRYRAESEWVWSEAPAIISGELFDKAQLQLQRNAAIARKMYRPTSRRYLLRTLVQCGECGLGMGVHPSTEWPQKVGSVPLSGTCSFWTHKSLCFEAYPAVKMGLYPLQGHYPKLDRRGIAPVAAATRLRPCTAC